MERRTSAGWIIVTAAAALVAVWAWWWRTQTLAQPAPVPAEDAWEQIRADFPMPAERDAAAPPSDELLKGVVSANPFDAKRRAKPPEADPAGGQAGSSAAPAAPRFIYKGRVNLGSKQRAILEETGAHKTYFLEVGQEVAGCKLLDIQETQVLLSTLNTNEPVVVPLAATQAGRP